MAGSPELNRRLLKLKQVISTKFNVSHWQELGLLTNCGDQVENHPRLFRSMRFGDDDYEGCAISVLRTMVDAAPNNLGEIEKYVSEQFPEEVDGEYVSSEPAARKIAFAPNVFQVPECPRESDLVAVMMPFAGFDSVYAAIKRACTAAGYQCLRADDIWEAATFMQDIFTLIFRSHVVISDFSGRNPNVMYETGIAHCLGRTVVPITRNKDDIPSDLGHHRASIYLPNSEGLQVLEAELTKRLRTLHLT